MSADATVGRGESAPRRPVVTVAALYGAGGSIVGPRVAERLGVPLLDREIPGDVARRTGLPEEAISEIDEKPRSGMERLLRTLGRASTITGGAAGSDERLDLQERQLRAYIEDFLARSSVSGGVTIGRGGRRQPPRHGDTPAALHASSNPTRLSMTTSERSASQSGSGTPLENNSSV